MNGKQGLYLRFAIRVIMHSPNGGQWQGPRPRCPALEAGQGGKVLLQLLPHAP